MSQRAGELLTVRVRAGDEKKSMPEGDTGQAPVLPTVGVRAGYASTSKISRAGRSQTGTR